jgi:hypothetical protein
MIRILLALGGFNILMAIITFSIDDNLCLLFCANSALFGLSAIIKANDP